MSQLAIRNTLLTPLFDAVDGSLVDGITQDDVAYENEYFDPSNKAKWLAVYVLPAESISLGQGSNSSDEERGILQISVYIKQDLPNMDLGQWTTLDDILEQYKRNSEATYVGTKVTFEDHTISAGRTDGAWFVRDISINYFSYIER